jgi:hypothetical protein
MRRATRFRGFKMAGAPATVCLLLSALLPCSASTPLFEKDVRPILKAHCFDCHGEAGVRKGGLDLRLRRLIAAGGDEGPAIVPGHPEQSLLLRLIENGDMPKRDRKLLPEQVEIIREWIASGAATAQSEPEDPGDSAGITAEERAFWSFQPIRSPEIPKTGPEDRVRTPVDAFLAAELAKRGLTFSEDADRITLLRRASFDLTGLPPSPEEVDAFLEDPSPLAYEQAIQRLLDSPHYGERWGRHWLDIAGYADSDGYSDADPPRAYAYKYRDYVIGSFNADKPLDRFIIEQLAGDELARATRENAQAALSAPHTLEWLIATGFLRMAADGSATPAVPDPEAVRNQVVADTIRIVSTSLLGLSVGCAQCHDHRYDPILQTDYYRIRAVLDPALDLKNWLTPEQRLISLYTDQDRAVATQLEAEARKLEEEKNARQKELIEAALTKHLEKFEPELRAKLREARDTPADSRTEEQKKLLADNPSVNITPGVLYQYDPKAAEELKAMDARIAEVRGRKPPEDFISALTEPADHLPVTRLFHRGDPRQPKEVVRPGALSVLAPEGQTIEFPGKNPSLSTSGRRLEFARWLTSRNNPLVARVLVNRVWLHHFGRGLVGTPSDFGAMGERPSHPELLDWLASEFMERGWRLSWLHKVIMTSTAYMQSSQGNPRCAEVDPDNRLYWRKSIQRLDAEAIRDSILSVSGALNKKMYGPPVPVRPDVHGQIVVGVDKTTGDNKMPVDVSLNGEEFRRSVYIQARRSRPLAILNVFDAPVMEVNCEIRQTSTSPTQSLMLMNSPFILDQAERFARRVHREAGDDPASQVTRAWRLAFSRTPTEKELRDSLDFLDWHISRAKASDGNKDSEESTGKPGDSEEKPASSTQPAPEVQALGSLCQALLSANELLYVD